ncbi:hypothetical protein BCR32DRAFT_115502 [Anaeromyces robustus]|uniref:Uncharacterized protein n=1 Tax=Anaeromyces robustus TaxID=1754192 RepID=A0A1Y1VVI3_9FUNG|nr:hypothetical protein BCR32DRAFT_115502 [Anaeromyces robustus]|eukprot:ORX65301.1 hypothetical protein BCR32DRAFT_115502 [Anaeromyces robustus]
MSYCFSEEFLNSKLEKEKQRQTNKNKNKVFTKSDEERIKADEMNSNYWALAILIIIYGSMVNILILML